MYRRRKFCQISLQFMSKYVLSQQKSDFILIKILMKTTATKLFQFIYAFKIILNTKVYKSVKTVIVLVSIKAHIVPINKFVIETPCKLLVCAVKVQQIINYACISGNVKRCICSKQH